MPTCQTGFTMIELVAAMVIIGILAAIVAPRFFSRNSFDSRSFYDQAISTLRYAQKAAIAQRRFVCAAFTANSITLTTGATAACGANLTGPTGLSPHRISSGNASFVTTPAALSFDALGRPRDAAGAVLPGQQSITVAGYATPIRIEGETGYVR